MARRRLDDDVPRIPRGKGLALSFGQILRIATVAVALVALIVLQKPCAHSVSKFVTDFGPVDAAVARPDAAPPALPDGIHLRTDMTPEQIKAAIDADRARRAALALDAGTAPADAAP